MPRAAARMDVHRCLHEIKAPRKHARSTAPQTNARRDPTLLWRSPRQNTGRDAVKPGIIAKLGPHQLDAAKRCHGTRRDLGPDVRRQKIEGIRKPTTDHNHVGAEHMQQARDAAPQAQTGPSALIPICPK